MANETALITGASAGIGRELAGLFAADGADLVLVARSGDALEELAGELRRGHGVQARVLACDLARPDAPREIVDRLEADGVTVDVLVNNAGFGARGKFAALDAGRQLDMIALNVTALTHLSRLLLPGMLARRRGGLLNVASTAAFQPGPYMAVYYATKAYVLHFSEALSEEVKGSGVRVTCLAPGPTRTGWAETAGMASSPLFRRGAMDAARVAAAGYGGFRRGRSLVVPGWGNWLLSALPRLLPRPLVRKAVKSMQK